MKYFINVIFLLISTSSFSGEDPRKQAFLEHLEKYGYEDVMREVAVNVSKTLPMTTSAGTTTYAISFYGTQLTYKSYFDLDAFNKAYKTSYSKSDLSSQSEDDRYIKGRVDSTCRNKALRPAIKMGMHVTDIMTWLDTGTHLHRTEIFEIDCRNAGL